MNELSLYECDEVIRAIEAKASMNDGELLEEDIQAIVEAQTKSIEKLGKLVNYVKHLEGFDTLAGDEIKRIQAKKKTAKNRVDSIKRYLLPWVEANGAKTVGTHKISTRKSKGVVLADGFSNPMYCEEVVTMKPDKKKIKQDIENGTEIKGAILEQRVSVAIK